MVQANNEVVMLTSILVIWCTHGPRHMLRWQGFEDSHGVSRGNAA